MIGQEPTREPVEQSVGSTASGHSSVPASAEAPQPHRSRWRPWLLALLVAAIAVLVPSVLHTRTHPSTPAAGPTSGTRRDINIPSMGQQIDAPTTWTRVVSDLRPDLSSHDSPPVLGHFPDGTVTSSNVINAGATWVLLTTNGQGGSEQAVALDPVTGVIRWVHGLDDTGMCASALLDDFLVCLSPTTRDASGLGTRWRVEELRPDTGQVVRSAEVDGWFCAVHVVDDHIVLVEQRLPAPHAQVTALTSALQPTWHIDLQKQSNHSKLFGENVYRGPLPNNPYGQSLDSLDLQDLSPTTVALHAGTATVVIDVDTGKQLGFPSCDRSHVDGTRLWCTEDEHVVGYTVGPRGLTRAVQTPAGTYLPVVYNGVGPALFCDDRENLVGIDPATGRANGRKLLTPPGRRAHSCEADFTSAGDLIIALDLADNGVSELDPTRLSERWNVPAFGDLLTEVAVAPRLVLAKGASGGIFAFDRAAGTPRSWGGSSFEHVAVVGDVPIIIDATSITRLRL